jgi:hypothetical protein
LQKADVAIWEGYAHVGLGVWVSYERMLRRGDAVSMRCGDVPIAAGWARAVSEDLRPEVVARILELWRDALAGRFPAHR